MEKITCEKCGKTKGEKEFFKMRTGNRDTLCKVCLTAHIDNYDPETFKWILERYNVPYLPEVWDKQIQKYLSDKGAVSFGPGSIIGNYLRLMNIAQYKSYTYADTERLQAEADQKKAEEAARRESARKATETLENALKEKLEKGEISEAEYNTLTYSNNEEEAQKQQQQNITFYNGSNEDEVLRNLTADDQMYLMTKWGAFYKPSEWVQMEKMYKNYEQEYDLNIDRAETLKTICKVSLKLNQAIDSGDLTGAKNYSGMLDTLRKSAKFTEAQNKEEIVKELDSIGELVALCEREGGIIEQFPINSDEYPQDKVDFTIKDLKAYNRNLIVNELGLGELIESYIEKLERRDKEDQEELENMITSQDEEDEAALTDAEAIDFLENLMEEQELEAERLLEEIAHESE